MIGSQSVDQLVLARLEACSKGLSQLSNRLRALQVSDALIDSEYTSTGVAPQNKIKKLELELSELDSLVEKLEEVGDEVAKMLSDKELAATSAWKTARTKSVEVEKLQRLVEIRFKELAVLAERCDVLQDEKDSGEAALVERLEDACNENQALQVQLENMLNSTSWKLTRPIRYLIQGLRVRLRE